MIVPTDYNLLENVSFYDPVQQRIYFKKEFWWSFFPRLRYDFKTTYGFLPKDMSSFVRDVKTKIFQYYYRKFVQGTKTNSLFNDLEAVFLAHKEKEDWDLQEQYRNARVLERQDTALTLVQVGRPSSPTFVDQLLDHFEALEESSSRELSMQVSFDEFARQFDNEQNVVDDLIRDYESGSLSKHLCVDWLGNGFEGILLTADAISKHYESRVGLATIVNALNTKATDGIHGMSKNFSIDRFHFFDKRHSDNEVYRALIKRMGRDKALFLYEKFMDGGNFYYSTKEEYVFCCFFCTAMLDIARKSVSSLPTSWMGKISRSKMSQQRGNNSLSFSDGGLNVSSGSLDSLGFGQKRSSSLTPTLGSRSSMVTSPVRELENTSPEPFMSERTSRSSLGSFGSNLSGASKWSGFGNSLNPR